MTVKFTNRCHPPCNGKINLSEWESYVSSPATKDQSIERTARVPGVSPMSDCIKTMFRDFKGENYNLESTKVSKSRLQVEQ
jgi:hypothetical protein